MRHILGDLCQSHYRSAQPKIHTRVPSRSFLSLTTSCAVENPNLILELRPNFKVGCALIIHGRRGLNITSPRRYFYDEAFPRPVSA